MTYNSFQLGGKNVGTSKVHILHYMIFKDFVSEDGKNQLQTVKIIFWTTINLPIISNCLLQCLHSLLGKNHFKVEGLSCL